MQVKLLDYGVPSEMQPKRAHANDVGADVYALKDRIIEVGCSAVIGLGFGLDLPAGFGCTAAPAQDSQRTFQCPRQLQSQNADRL